MTSTEFTHSLDALTPALKPFALKLTKDLEEANDLMQETLLKAFVNREKFTMGTNLKAWLYTIMKNTFITNYQRMMKRGTFVDTTDNQHFLNTGIGITQNEAHQNFAIKDMEEAIEELTDTYKIPFMMHFNGFKYFEISERLEIPIGTVKNRIHIARKKLRTALPAYNRSK